MAFRNDPFLLLGAPGAAAPSSGENLKPPHCRRVGFGQKLSVRHVSIHLSQETQLKKHC
jgi:hypothetical protein